MSIETGSLSAGARQLKTPLRTVSRKVSELKSHLRTKLFNRSSRKSSEAKRAASGEYSAPTGELIVTAPVGLGRAYLIPILADFLKAYPDIKASLFLANRVQSLFSGANRPRAAHRRAARQQPDLRCASVRRVA